MSKQPNNSIRRSIAEPIATISSEGRIMKSNEWMIANKVHPPFIDIDYTFKTKNDKEKAELATIKHKHNVFGKNSSKTQNEVISIVLSATNVKLPLGQFTVIGENQKETKYFKVGL